MKFLRIKNWNELYENNETRKLNNLRWVPIPNRMESISFRELMGHRNGLPHFGVWILLLELASKQPKPRDGTISRSGGRIPHDAESIAKAIGSVGAWDDSEVLEMVIGRARFDSVRTTITEAIDRLIDLGWLELIEIPSASVSGSHFWGKSSQVVDNFQKSGDSPDAPGSSGSEGNRREINICASDDARGSASCTGDPKNGVVDPARENTVPTAR